jgi:hypothetical protein
MSTAPVPVAPRTGRLRARPGSAGTLLAVAEALAVTALLLWITRRLFLDGDQLDRDFANDAWYARHQAEALRDGHLPSLFLSQSRSAFYPIFAFYGGTLFVVFAAVSLVTGNALVAEAIVYVAALAAAYGGWLWLARMAGVRRWLAHAPAIAYVTAPYVITNIYARQDLVETVATAMMPLMVAAAISVGRAERLRAGPVAALAVATILFTGSHNLTLLFGTLFLVLLGLLVVAAVPAARTLVGRRGALRVLVVVVPAVAVNAWFLLPDLFYASHTAIAQRTEAARALLRVDADEFSLGHLLTPGRPDAAEASGYTLPVLVLVWAVLALIAARPPRRSPLVRLFAVLAALTLAIVVLIPHADVVAALPSPVVLLQSAGRLVTFAVFGICALLLVALAAARRPGRALSAALVAVLALGTVQALGQAGNVVLATGPTTPPIDDVTTFGLGDYADAGLPIVTPPANAPSTTLGFANVRRNRAELTISAAPGTMFLTNLMGPAAMLHAEGVRFVARWAVPSPEGWQRRWYLVAQIDPGATGTRHRVVITPARSAPIVAGRVISVLGLAGLLALAAVIALRAAPLRPRAPRPRRRSAAAP